MVTPALRIIFFGTPAFAVPTLARLIGSRHAVVAVVSQPDRPRGRGHHLAATATKEVALAAGVPVLQPERLREPAFLEDIAALGADLGVVAAYGKLLPESLLALPRLGMINVHGSLLPRWRGAAPVHRAIIAGDDETGVTIMRVVKELDAGAMFSAVRWPIGIDDTSVEVERDLAQIGADLLLETVDALADGRASETPQPADGITYAAKLTRAESAVPWTLPAAAIHNAVRGLQPWPLVSARLAGTRILLHRTQLTGETLDQAAGTVARIDADGIVVVAGDGRGLRLVDLQPEGRRVMRAREFVAGRRLEAGALIETA
jgi:methionyl-tRNA formyltransferase